MSTCAGLIAALCFIFGLTSGESHFYIEGHIWLAAAFVLSSRRPA